MPGSHSRRRSLEKDLHHRRIASSSSMIAPGLPPVVIHSPVRTPNQGLRTLDEVRYSTPPGDDDDDDLSDLPSPSDSEYPRAPLSLITESLEGGASTSQLSSPPLTANSAYSVTRPSSLISSSSLSDIDGDTSMSRRDRSDSELSLMVTGMSPLAAVIEEPMPVGRQRRRVNISGRLAVVGDAAALVRSEVDLLAVPVRTLSTRSKPTLDSALPPITTTEDATSATSTTSGSTPLTLTSSPRHKGLSFSRQDRPAPPAKSALAALFSALSASDASSQPTNPFSTFYGALSSRSATDSAKFSVYFPHSTEPAKKLLLRVKKDLSVEELIGVGLGAYVDDQRKPALELGEGEEERETAKWNLRIVEDDGEVDEDFPGKPSGRLTFRNSTVANGVDAYL